MVAQAALAIALHDASIELSIHDDELRLHGSVDEIKGAVSKRSSSIPLKGVLTKCCSPSKPFKSKTISLYEVLSATYSEKELSISVIRRHHKKSPIKTYIIRSDSEAQCQSLVEKIWQNAYRNGSPRKRVKVLLNPFGGSGQAKIIYNDTVLPIFQAARYVMDVQETTHSGHAAEIAQGLDLTKYDAVVCVSGDGLPHEVINGLARRKDARRALLMPIGFIPAGSGNGSAKSIYDTQKRVECTLGVVKGFVTPVDLLSITQGKNRYVAYFSLSYGVIADCDLGTEHLRWMGEARFTYGVVQRILSRTNYPCTLSLSVLTDDKQKITAEYHDRSSTHTMIDPFQADEEMIQSAGLPDLKYGTVNDPVPTTWVTHKYPKMGTFYVGMMPYMSSTTCFFPTASPASGSLDVLFIQADIPFFSALSTISAVDKAKHFDCDLCYYAKCDAFRLVPEKTKGFISVDGEQFPFEPIQGELHHALGRIITKNGQYYSQFGE